MGVLAFGDTSIDSELANDEAVAEQLDAQVASHVSSVVEVP
jgi:hypothetical protein